MPGGCHVPAARGRKSFRKKGDLHSQEPMVFHGPGSSTPTPRGSSPLSPSPFWLRIFLVSVLLGPAPDFSVTMAVIAD